MRRLLLVLLAGGLFLSLHSTPTQAASTFYVDSVNGNDSWTGTFPTRVGQTNIGPWQHLQKINDRTDKDTSGNCVATCAGPGDFFYLRAGSYFIDERLTVDGVSGSSSARIHIEKHGSGTDPIIQGLNPCVDIKANWIDIVHINVTFCGQVALCGCQPVGFRIEGDNNMLSAITAQNNQTGVSFKAGSDNNRLLLSLIHNNTQGDGTGSSGTGINLHGSNNTIDFNTIQQNYWVDPDDNNCRHGSGIEVYGDDGFHADDNYIHHNTAINNEAFSEIGMDIDQNGTPNDHTDDIRLGTADDNVYIWNVIRGDLAPTNCGSTTSCSAGWNGMAGLITRGDGLVEPVSPGTGTTEYGPVLGTIFNHNSILFTGECSQGIVCSGDCDGSIINVINTVVSAKWKGGFFGNKSGISFPASAINYSLFRETGSGQGNQSCQFQTPAVGDNETCPALTNGLAHNDQPEFESESTWNLRPDCDNAPAPPDGDGDPSPLINTGFDFTDSKYNSDFVGTAITTPDVGAYEAIC